MNKFDPMEEKKYIISFMTEKSKAEFLLFFDMLPFL